MRESVLVTGFEGEAVPIHVVGEDTLQVTLAALAPHERAFAEAQVFKAQSGRAAFIPDSEGHLGRVLFGRGGGDAAARDPMICGRLAPMLPPGAYRLAEGGEDSALATLAFALGSYSFERYRGQPRARHVKLAVPPGIDAAALRRIETGVFLARDLINTPANDLSPRDLADAAEALAVKHGAEIAIVEGGALERGFPMLHAVGAGSDRPPCLIDMRWGPADASKVTLVGKGIVFDTGGLDIKPSSGMALMKKDMGGAANVLGLASMIMDAGLRLRLRVLIPAAENAISGRAFRPGDVLKSRKGLTVEVGNTDAEGRLVLADALALADEESPALLVTMATLTGAARVALGPELPPYYCDDTAFVAGIEKAAAAVSDPVWRMPLWRPYDSWLASKVADVSHIASNSFAGSVVAALFLRRFVSGAEAFAHFDIFAWNPSARSIGPEGGEAQAIRALYAFLASRHG
jgi:leucyl aminopeptidase